MQLQATIRRPFISASANPSSCNASTRDTAPRGLRSVGRKLALLSSSGTVPVAAAWAEDITDAAQQGVEAGRQALSASQVPQWSQIQVPGGLKAPVDVANILGNSSVNPILLLGAVAAIAVPTLLFQALNPGSKVKGTSPANAVSTLMSEPSAQLLDIRPAAAVKAEGSPVLKGAKRRTISLPYTRVSKDRTIVPVEGWAEKAAKLGALKPDSIVILLDSDGKSAKKAAAELDGSSLEEIFFVSGGASSWQSSGEAWKEAGRGFSLDLSGIKQSFSQGLGTMRIKAGDSKDGEGSGGLPNKQVLVGAGAVLGAVLLFSQTGLFLEIVGLGAAANFGLKNFVFAKDRERSTKQFRELVAPDEAVKDVQRLTSVLLDTGGNLASASQAKVEGALDEAKEWTAEARQEVKSAVSDTKSDVKSGGKDAANDVESAADDVKTKARDAKDDAKDWIGSWKGRSDAA